VSKVLTSSGMGVYLGVCTSEPQLGGRPVFKRLKLLRQCGRIQLTSNSFGKDVVPIRQSQRSAVYPDLSDSPEEGWVFCAVRGPSKRLGFLEEGKGTLAT
jgi:hypothetical protein